MIIALSIIGRLIRDERAQDMVEYALLAGFVAVAAGATLPNIAQELGDIFRVLTKLLFIAGGRTRATAQAL